MYRLAAEQHQPCTGLRTDIACDVQVKILETRVGELQKELDATKSDKAVLQEQNESLTRTLATKEHSFVTMCDELTAMSLE